MTRIYQRINTEDEEETKRRVIVLEKQSMFDEVDAHTSKFVDATQPASPEQKNAISSDSSEDVDGSIITRLMEYWKAKLVRILKAVLAADHIEYSKDDIKSVVRYKFILDLPVDFKDQTLDSLQTLMHKYIVWGILYDWYKLHAIEREAALYKQELDDIEKDIQSDICPDGYAKRPMQPFGPAHMPI